MQFNILYSLSTAKTCSPLMILQACVGHTDWEFAVWNYFNCFLILWKYSPPKVGCTHNLKAEIDQPALLLFPLICSSHPIFLSDKAQTFLHLPEWLYKYNYTGITVFSSCEFNPHLLFIVCLIIRSYSYMQKQPSESSNQIWEVSLPPTDYVLSRTRTWSSSPVRHF